MHKTSIQIKKGLQNRSLPEDTYMRIRRILAFVLQCSFIFALFFRFASVLEGTGKGVAMKKVNRNNGAIDVTTVGGRIKKLRTDAGFTQEELAIELHLEGKSAISNYENNSRGVSAEMLTQLSRLFHVSADYILNGDSPDNLDPIVNEAIEILNNLKAEKAKRSALEMLRQIQILEG